MKNFISLISLFIISLSVHAQSPWYFGSGEAVNLTDAIKYKSGVRQVSGPLDPTITAVPGEAGSVYLSTSGNMYLKQDSGLSTNWNLVGAGDGGGGISTINGQSGPSVSIAVGTSGTNANVTATGNTVTVNLPTASATNRGLLSNTDWTTFNSKENGIASGTTSQYFRGDKTWQTLNKAAVGLGNVDNTSDLNKPISTATQTALNNKAPSLKNYPKVLPSLDLNFARDQKLDPRITFSRTSARTCINKFGLIYSLDVDEPCFDHDPETLESKGLLIEESRTNLLTHSNDFNQPQWVGEGISVIPNATVAPDGSLTATRLMEDTSDSRHSLKIGISVTSGTTYTVSFFVKNNGKTFFSINPADANFGPTAHAYFNLVTGQVISGETGTGEIQHLPNNWYRCSYTVTASATGNSNFYIEFKEGTGSYVGDGTSGIYIWEAQLEEGSFPTSIIKTEDAPVTRAADLASITGANFSSWYNQSEGTFVSKFSTNAQASNRVWEVNDGTNNNSISHFNSPTGNVTTTMATAGVSQLTGIQNSYTLGSISISGLSYKLNNVGQSLNGSTPVSDLSASLPAVDRLYLGQFQGTTGFLNGTISHIRYYPKSVTNNELMATADPEINEFLWAVGR